MTSQNTGSIRIAAIVPHLLCFGGVRRFLELGNEFVRKGHDYTLHARKHNSLQPSWFGPIDFEVRDCDEIEADFVLIGDPPSFPLLKNVRGEIFIYVIAGPPYIDQYKEMEGKYPMILNNRSFLSHFPQGTVVEGGVNTNTFRRRKLLRVGYYAGRGGIKGEDFIVRELAPLNHVQLIPIKNFDNETLPLLYSQLHYFVSHERREGWANMMAEALACNVPVVCSGKNWEPFGDRVIRVTSLREFFENPMERFSWSRVADRLLRVYRACKS